MGTLCLSGTKAAESRSPTDNNKNKTKDFVVFTEMFGGRYG
jgi:hypothetical protein